MRKHQELSLEQIIEQVRVDKFFSDDFCLYGKEDGELALERLYWVSDYGEQLFDVLSVALEEKPNASHQDLVDALNYYNRYDIFMNFES